MANHKLSYYSVVNEILSRVNDPDGDTYLARAKELTYEGICAMVLSEYGREGYPSLMKSEQISVDEISAEYRVCIAGSNNELTSNVLKIVSITDDLIETEMFEPGTIIEHRYIEIDTDKYNRLNDVDERPFKDEIYYYRQGDYIYFYPHDDMSNQKIIIHYIAAPEEYEYESAIGGVESTELTGLYSLDFLYKVIDYGSGRIRAEQSGE